jgi:thioredoxin 1
VLLVTSVNTRLGIAVAIHRLEAAAWLRSRGIIGYMATSNRESARFIVACLCAEWCSSCREYRDTFAQVAQDFAGVRFMWVDVEDRAALVDGVDVDNFPTVLIASGDEPRFFGALTPQPETLVRLVRAHVVDESGTFLEDPNLRALVAALRTLTSE